MENVRKKETFDLIINVRPDTITRHGHCVSYESCKICLWEESFRVKAFVVCSEINVLN